MEIRVIIGVCVVSVQAKDAKGFAKKREDCLSLASLHRSRLFIAKITGNVIARHRRRLCRPFQAVCRSGRIFVADYFL
jgi:hypothetical protein